MAKFELQIDTTKAVESLKELNVALTSFNKELQKCSQKITQWVTELEKAKTLIKEPYENTKK